MRITNRGRIALFSIVICLTSICTLGIGVAIGATHNIDGDTGAPISPEHPIPLQVNVEGQPQGNNVVVYEDGSGAQYVDGSHTKVFRTFPEKTFLVPVAPSPFSLPVEAKPDWFSYLMSPH